MATPGQIITVSLGGQQILKITQLNRTNEYLVLALGKEAAVLAVVDSTVWAFRRLKKPRCQEMSARGYALHSVCPQLSFFS